MIAGITDWILGLNGWVALAIVFLLPALEASAFLGFLFPGEIAVILGGVLAFEGRISLTSAILAAVLGAFIGDNVGYFVGKRWGHQILRGIGKRIPFLKHRVDEHLETARAYIKRRGGRAVLIGRFTAALRVMVPGLAGMSGMPYGRFAAFNGAGAIVWGTGFVLLGYFAGAAWHTVADVAGKIGIGLAALLLIGLVSIRLLRRVREGDRTVADHLAALAPIAWLRRRYPRSAAWLARRMDTSTTRGFLLTIVLVAGGLCGWVFGGLTQDVVAHEEAVNLDPGIERFVIDHRVTWLTDLFRAFTWLGSNAVLIPVVAALVVYFIARRRNWRPAALAVAALAGAIALYDIVKPLVGRPRPQAHHLVGVSGFSFPSGHATAVTAVWGMVATLLLVGAPVRRKVLVGILVALVVILVAISRVYLGVHWYTDVVGGIALGGLWLCVLWMIAILSGGLVDAGVRRTSGSRARSSPRDGPGSNSEAAA
ncbi:MAG: bifunctional DedA family/phosphatase PAP2 family protein [Actinomycetota bacterium]|nr:bifunctional DedA family/phosphatase PAP2 family protein [Actinomycetota bacterium]